MIDGIYSRKPLLVRAKFVGLRIYALVGCSTMQYISVERLIECRGLSKLIQTAMSIIRLS
jgi:hypothetical protein